MMFVLDLDTIRLLPHLPGIGDDPVRPDLAGRRAGDAVAAVDPAGARSTRAAAAGLTAFAGTELEFIVFNDTYEEAWDAGYRGLTPANQYNVDYSILGTTRVEPLLRDIRNTMYAAGLTVESAKGECNFGQHEIAFRFAEVLTTARQPRRLQERRQGDRRPARPCADLHGQVQRAGGQLLPHPPLAARRRRRLRVLGRRRAGERTPLYDHFVAGMLATMREFTLLYAPNINSYKRFADGSFAPTTVAWGLDNRTCAVRLVGHGPSAAAGEPGARRRRQSVPGDRRRCWPAGCTASSSELRAGGRADRQRLHVRQADACRGRCARPGTCSTGRRWPGRRSVTRWSTTTFTRPTPSWPRSTPR